MPVLLETDGPLKMLCLVPYRKTTWRLVLAVAWMHALDKAMGSVDTQPYQGNESTDRMIFNDQYVHT